ncbi:MAG: SPOR domain-containing protein [Gemmatimonadaceae bacterium]
MNALPRVFAIAAAALLPAVGTAQSTDSTLARIARLASAGDRSGARLLADSLVGSLPADAPTYPDALYWRAFTAATAAEAERDYLRLAVEYPLAPRSEDALLLLSQLEFARGDRGAALRHLDRLLRDHPGGHTAGRATLWTARIAFDTGDSVRACRALVQAREMTATEDVETRNQVEYFLPRCAARAVSNADSSVGPSPTTKGPEYCLQVAAFKTKREAEALQARLKRRGFDARVTHTDSWYRIRVGRYATRREAEAAQARAKRGNVTARVVEAETR